MFESPIQRAAHLNFAGVKGGDVVIVSVLTTPSERDGESGQGYYCLLRAPHADTPGWLPVENVKKHREKYWAAALQETFTGVRNLSCLDSESFSNDLLRLDQITVRHPMFRLPFNFLLLARILCCVCIYS